MLSRYLALVLGTASLAAIAGLTSPPSIRRVATLHTARSVHTATALSSGQVLLAGGMATGEGSLASVELFDPGSNTLRDLPPLHEARDGHTATRLPDGRVLIAGGYNGDYLASVEVFDPVEQRFRSGGTLLEGRSGHTATLLPSGQVLFIGGVGRGWTFLASAELYDPASGRSVAVGPLSVPRESHTATLLADGRVLVVGGHNGRRQAMQVYASAELFDPETRRFTPTGPLTTPRHKHDALRLADGRVLVIGGADRTDRVHFATTELYDPRAGSFSPGPAMAAARYKIAGTSVLLSNGDVLIAAGAPNAELLPHGMTTFEPVSGRFPASYQFATATLLPGDNVVIVGGYDDRIESTAGVWRFGPR